MKNCQVKVLVSYSFCHGEQAMSLKKQSDLVRFQQDYFGHIVETLKKTDRRPIQKGDILRA